MIINSLAKKCNVFITIDTMAMIYDRSCLSIKRADYAFVIFVRPLKTHLNRMPLYVISWSSSPANDRIRAVIMAICDELERSHKHVDYFAIDGNTGCNQHYQEFFSQ
jgi:hypothetical protein